MYHCFLLFSKMWIVHFDNYWPLGVFCSLDANTGIFWAPESSIYYDRNVRCVFLLGLKLLDFIYTVSWFFITSVVWANALTECCFIDIKSSNIGEYLEMVIQCSCTVTKALVPSEISISTVLPGRYLKLQTYDADTMQIGLESMWCICYFYDSMILISSLVCLIPCNYIVYSRNSTVLLLLSFLQHFSGTRD